MEYMGTDPRLAMRFDGLAHDFDAIPSIGAGAAYAGAVPRPAAGAADTPPRGRMRQVGVPVRLKRLDKYLSQGLISQAEHNAQRVRILREI